MFERVYFPFDYLSIRLISSNIIDRVDFKNNLKQVFSIDIVFQIFFTNLNRTIRYEYSFFFIP